MCYSLESNVTHKVQSLRRRTTNRSDSARSRVDRQRCAIYLNNRIYHKMKKTKTNKKNTRALMYGYRVFFGSNVKQNFTEKSIIVFIETRKTKTKEQSFHESIEFFLYFFLIFFMSGVKKISNESNPMYRQN